MPHPEDPIAENLCVNSPSDSPSPDREEKRERGGFLNHLTQSFSRSDKSDALEEHFEQLETRLGARLEAQLQSRLQEIEKRQDSVITMVNPLQSQLEAMLAQLESRLTPLETAVQNVPTRPDLDSLGEQMREAERKHQEAQEMLFQTFSESESNHVATVAQLRETFSTTLEQHGKGIEHSVERYRNEIQNFQRSEFEKALVGFWSELATLQKLECLASSVPANSALADSLRAAKETLMLLEQTGDAFLNWTEKYPSACAEKLQTLFNRTGDNGSATEKLIELTLEEARNRIGAKLQELSIALLTPSPGDALSPDWETVQHETSLLPKGTVVRVLRPGLTRYGKPLIAPAVTISADTEPRDTVPSVTVESFSSAVPAQPSPAVSSAASPASEEVKPEPVLATSVLSVPRWLNTLQSASLMGENPEERRLLAALERLVTPREAEGTLASLETVLPLLSLCRLFYTLPVSEKWRETWEQILPEFVEWLEKRYRVVPISPASGEWVEEERMEVIETRRTLHESERNRVSRLERPGAMQTDRVLFRAQVQAFRYEGG